jgi:two-component system cell cycle sensor histidine kinase PleC
LKEQSALGEAAHSAAPLRAPAGKMRPAQEAGKSQRSTFLLIILFLIAFALSTVMQVESARRENLRAALDADAEIAHSLSRAVDVELSAARAAADAAARMAQLGAPPSVALAAAQAPVVRAAGLVSASGEILAATETQLAATFIAAARGADQAGAWRDDMWIGAPNVAGATGALVLVRRAQAGRIVLVLDTQALTHSIEDEHLRAVLATEGGASVFVSTALAGASADSRTEIIAVASAAPDRAFVARAGGDERLAIASAQTEIGALRVITIASAPTEGALWFAAIARYALMAAAPLAALGVLYLLTRQNARRARLAEADAQRAETHFRLAADGARAGVLEWRVQADSVQLSEQAVRLLGAVRDTLTLKEFIELIVAEDRFATEEEFRRARQSGLLDARFRVTRAQSLAWIEARGAGLDESGGFVDGRLFATIVDATPRHEAEARVSRLERQLRAAIESFSGPFALWDTRRRLVLWNASFGALFDLSPELLRPRASYEAIAAASAARIRRERHDPADTDVRIIELMSGEWLQIVERRAGDGGLITVGVDISALKRKEEELARNERRLQDALTRAETQEYKIKALAREAQEERQKAEDASRAKSAFLANMSHELRTPLNAVIGFSEIMSKELFGKMPNDQYRQYSSDIFDSGNHLLDLINDILDMAKIEAGKLTLAPRPLDPAIAIDQAVRLTKRKAEDKGLNIVVDAENLPEIEADHRAVKQMLLNLLSNAVKFTDAGAIMVHARANAQGLTLRVVDTGCGIPPEHLPRLAQPFQQVEQELARNHSGTGLGLALTKSLAEMHGGKLAIQSEVGKGTIVTISLPRVFGGTRTPEQQAESEQSPFG